jgi:S1-C subfamily serine protease
MKVRPFFGFVGLTLLGVTILAGCDRDNLSIRTKGGAMASMDFRKTVQNAKAKVFPAVVYIKCLREEFAGGRKTTQEVLGSGVIIDGIKGEVLTNWHVIDKAREIRCLLSDGRYFNAKKIGDDKDTDLALIQLQGIPKSPKGLSALPAAGFGESLKLKEGDFVMAMGAPFGLNRSVSIGIISCTRRYLSNSSEYSLWLQTDASINPGNSGGPLVDTDGKIIGINTRGGANMGFATPSHNILSILPQMREHGKVNWSWTGLQLQPLRNFNKNTYFDGDTGVIVSETEPDSPARRAGVQVRDRIIKLNGQPLTALWVHVGTRGLLLNVLSLWIFGSALEKWWGPRRFVRFWIITGVAGLILGVLVGQLQPAYVMAGSAGAAVAMMVAFAVIFPEHMVFFYGLLPLKAKHLILVLLGLVLLTGLFGSSYLDIAVQLGGGLCALLMLWWARRRSGTPQGPGGNGGGSKFQVIKGGKKDEPKVWN